MADPLDGARNRGRNDAISFGFTDGGEVGRLADDDAAVGRRAIEGFAEGVVEMCRVHSCTTGSAYMSPVAG